MQIRFEIAEGVAGLLDRHNREGRNPSPISMPLTASIFWHGKGERAPENMYVTFCMPTSSGTPGFTINPLTSSGNTR